MYGEENMSSNGNSDITGVNANIYAITVQSEEIVCLIRVSL